MKKQPPVSPEQYRVLIQTLAAQGNAKAQHNLGAMYLEGRGVDRDLEQAVKWFRLAAAQGVVLSQHNLGISYLKGLGVSVDPEASARWFRKAAEQGDPRSQHSLGAMYFEGLGVEKDLVTGYFWLTLAKDGAPDDFRDQVEVARDCMAEAMQPQERQWAMERVQDYKRVG